MVEVFLSLVSVGSDEFGRKRFALELFPISIVIASALLGSLPFGFILAKYFLRVDLKAIGSGNIGATNAARAGGPGFGALILALDALKGFTGAFILSTMGVSEVWVAGAGLAAVFGHCYTPFLGWEGGKGVATSLGVILAFEPWLGGLGLIVYALVLVTLRTSSIGSLAATGACVLVAWIMPQFSGRLPMRVALLVICVLIVWRHRSNLAALRQKPNDGPE
jgi:glycerol-3-phosphate acyltransferase PlsY